MKDHSEVIAVFSLRFFSSLATDSYLFFLIRHGECPTPENTETFIRVCEHFSEKNPTELIGMSNLFSLVFAVNLFFFLYSLLFLTVTKEFLQNSVYACIDQLFF